MDTTRAQDRHPGVARARFLGEPEKNPRRGHPPRLAHWTCKFAGELGYTIKLLGIVKTTRIHGCRVQVSVYPTLIPNSHVLASVNGVFNAVFVRGDIVGDSLFYGRGAGKDATASAVLSDLADAALDLKFGTKHRLPPFVPQEYSGSVTPIDEVVSQYFVRLNVVDKPGVLAKIATIFGESDIGISSVIQPEGHEGESVPLIFMLHYATNGAVQRGAEKNRPFARHQRQAGHDPGGKF